MKKHKYLLSFLMIFAFLGTGLVFKYSNLPLDDESRYILSKNIVSPLNGKTTRSLQGSNKYGDKVNSILNEMRAFGIPLEMDEILTSYNPETLNGTEDFKHALSLLKEADKNSALSKLGEMWKAKLDFTSEEIERISELLKDGGVQELIEFAKKASEKDYIDFEINYKDGPGTALPHLGQIRNLMKILSLKSVSGLKSGELEDSVNNLNTALKLKSMSNDNVTMIGELVENAVSGMLSENLQNLRGTGVDLGETYKLLERDLSTSLDKQLNSLDGERMLLGNWLFDKMQNSPEVLQSDEIKSIFGEGVGKISEDEIKGHYADYLKNMMEIREIMEEPYYVNSGKLDEKLKSINDSSLLKELIPSYSKIYKKYNAHQSLLKRNLLSLKLDEYEQKNGLKPETLKELDIPQDYLIDNITGKPYQLISDSEGNVRISHLGEIGNGLKL